MVRDKFFRKVAYVLLLYFANIFIIKYSMRRHCIIYTSKGLYAHDDQTWHFLHQLSDI